MPLVATAFVWALAAPVPAATAESAPAGVDLKAVSPHCATLLEAGPWFPPSLRPTGADWAQDLRILCSTDRKSEEQRLREVYGVGEYAGHLFECIRHAAAIIPRFTDLVCEPSDRYMPQMGLLLVDYVELPTRSLSREQGRITGVATAPAPAQTAPADSAPERQPTRVIGIRDFVNGRSAAGAATPETIALELRQHVDACRSRLPDLRHVTPPDAAKAQLLDALLNRIEFGANLGEHLSHKIHAAVAWERFRKSGTGDTECTRHLRESLDDWDRVVAAADRLPAKPFPCWQARMVSAPPWSLRSYQASYVSTHSPWREQKRLFEQELTLISESIRQKKGSATLPQWDRVDGLPKQNLDPVAAFGFNLNPDRRYSLKDGATITTDQRLALTAGRSVLIDTRALGPGGHVAFKTEPNHATMLAYRSYQISLLYRVVDRGGEDNQPFEIGVMGSDGQPVLAELGRWGAPDNYIDTRVIKIPRLDRDDCSFFIKVYGPAAIVIDDLRISAIKDE